MGYWRGQPAGPKRRLSDLELLSMARPLTRICRTSFVFMIAKNVLELCSLSEEVAFSLFQMLLNPLNSIVPLQLLDRLPPAPP